MTTTHVAAADALLEWLDNQDLEAKDAVLVLGMAMSALIMARASETGNSAECDLAAIETEMRGMMMDMRE